MERGRIPRLTALLLVAVLGVGCPWLRPAEPEQPSPVEFDETLPERHYTDEGVMIALFPEGMEEIFRIARRAAEAQGVRITLADEGDRNSRIAGNIGPPDARQDVAIDLTRIGPSSTRVAVKIGLFGNRRTSNDLMDAMSELAGMNVGQ